MGLEHFIPRRMPVHEGGHAYLCRGPTVATVHLVLGYYASEIVAARLAWDEDPPVVDAGELVRLAVAGLAEAADDRVRRVLETCVDGDLSAAPLRRLAEACLELCDLPRILGGVDLRNPDAGDTPAEQVDETVSDQSVAICKLAGQYGCSPMDVMDWPYEALLEAMEVAAAATPEAPAGEPTEDIASLPGFSLTDARRPGG